MKSLIKSIYLFRKLAVEVPSYFEHEEFSDVMKKFDKIEKNPLINVGEN